MKSLFVYASELRVGDEFVLPASGNHLQVLSAPALCEPPPLTDKDRLHVGMRVKDAGQDKPVNQTFYADLEVLVTYREPPLILGNDDILETKVHTVDHGEQPGLHRWSAHITVSDHDPGHPKHYTWDERANTEAEALKLLTVRMGRAFLREVWRSL